MTIKTKPFLHLKAGETIIFKSSIHNGTEKQAVVSKVEEWNEDVTYVKVTFPEVQDKEGRTLEESFYLVFPWNEQVTYVDK